MLFLVLSSVMIFAKIYYNREYKTTLKCTNAVQDCTYTCIKVITLREEFILNVLVYIYRHLYQQTDNIFDQHMQRSL